MAVEFTRNEVATLWASFGTPPVDPVNLLITIYDPDGTLVIGPTSMTKVEVGLYKYEFTISDGWTLGVYAYTCEGTLSGVAFQEVEAFNVLAEETLVGSDLPTTEYCTLAQVRRELVGISELDRLADIDEIIIQHIYRVTEEVDYLCGKTFKSVTQTAYVNGSGISQLLLPQRPVTALTDCKIRIQPEYDWYTFTSFAYQNIYDSWGTALRAQSTDAEIMAADLWVDCGLGQLTIPPRISGPFLASYPAWNYTFVAGHNNVLASYTYGYSAASRPRAVQELAVKMVAIEVLLLCGQLLSQGASGMSVGEGVNWGPIPYEGRVSLLRERRDELVGQLRDSWLGS